MKDKLNILIANDDGIDSPGIVRLAEAASKFGNVWVAAPSSQCSGMSQKLTIFGEFPVSRPAFPVPVMDAWSIGGTPADCVKLAVNFLMPVKPDVVFSGINFGYNTGFDIAYSGTVGAAMEALINGIPAIAFSSQHDGSSDVTDKYLVPVIEELISSPIGRGEIWNVNFPGCALEDCRGILRGRIPAPLCVFDNHYDKTEQPDGSFILRPYAEQLSCELAPEGSDIHAVFNGYVSIGMISKMYITAIEDLDTHILESLDAMGCTPFQKIRYGVIPQLTASFISTTIYRFDINLKDATTLGIVGAGGIGASLVQCLNSRRWAMVGSFVWGLMVLVLIIEFISTRIRRKLAHGA